ncbi:MAG: hypothetical protein PHE77_01100 [Candidatus Pacebacteria bacterium]|nr:hypothetical protein [Candidatus Paceibacterota bacterium]
MSWEVCNKVGGIWTVLKSKARPTIEYYKENYCLIGPYFNQNSKGEFEEEKIPKNWEGLCLDLEKEGLKLKFGNWLVSGVPKAILIDFSQWLKKADQIKKELWDNFKVDSWKSPRDYTEPVVWAYASGRVIEKLSQAMPKKKIVAQFHEWLSGAGLLYLKTKQSPVGSVFTTHATVLGRTLTNANVPVDGFLGKINSHEQAYRYGVQSKHLLEQACAKSADVFTTVSHITALESETILGKFPDVLLPNGLDMSRFPFIEEISIKHKLQRDKIRNFIFWYFFPFYSFDLKETLFYFTIGRYELKNKGIDVFIKSLSELNKKLKQEKSKKTIVTFFWVPTQIQSIKRELIESREIYTDIKDHLESIEEDVEGNILQALVKGGKMEKTDVFANKEEALIEIKNKILKFKKQGQPPLCTHNLENPNDEILEMLYQAGLENSETDKVKVIFYPIYLNGADGILNLTADEAVQGSHLGVFPSLYEPWGYTPLEAAASGVASITTDLAGFGRFCNEYIKGKKLPGVFILERLGKSDEETVSDLTKILYNFCKLPMGQRVENKIQARRLADLADWEVLIKNYITAHNKACK